MSPDKALLRYVLRLGDNALVLGQRMIERVTHEPELEEELANANFALDYIGQARMFYSYAGELEGEGHDEDYFAYRRDGHEFGNFLLVEQPNGHFGDSIARQVLFETYYVLQLEALADCSDEHLAGIAARALKEIRYHLRHARQWLVRLGDGTDESHAKMQDALERHWRYCGELFDGDEVDAAFARHFDGPDPARIGEQWHRDVRELLSEATLNEPESPYMKAGGRRGVHSEHFGYLIAEMQHLQRAYPGATW